MSHSNSSWEDDAELEAFFQAQKPSSSAAQSTEISSDPTAIIEQQERALRPNLRNEKLKNYLRTLSEEQDDDETMKMEWKFTRLHDLKKCKGTCPCGQKYLRYHCEITNKKTLRRERIGSTCIEQFDQHKKIFKAFERMITKGYVGHFVEEIEPGRPRFAMYNHSIFHVSQNVLERLFGHLPICQDPQQIPILEIVNNHPSSSPTFQGGKRYLITIFPYSPINEQKLLFGTVCAPQSLDQPTTSPRRSPRKKRTPPRKSPRKLKTKHPLIL